MNRRDFIITGLTWLVAMYAPAKLQSQEARKQLKFEPITIDQKLLKELGIEKEVKAIDDKIRDNDLFGIKDPDEELYKLLGTLDVKTAEELVKQRLYDKILTRYTKPVEAMIRYALFRSKEKTKISDIFNVYAIGNRGKAITYFNNHLSNSERVKLLKNAEIWFIRSLVLRESSITYVNLASLYAISFGNSEKGIVHYDNALRINPNNSVAKVLKRKVVSKELECHKTAQIFSH